MTTKVYHSQSLEDLENLVVQIMSDCNESIVFTFTGDLGAGKTTLIKSICAHLGYTGDVTSPTFSIINEYSSSKIKIYHMDLYRLKNLEEAIDIGLEDYLFSNAYCLIEWPQVALDMLDLCYYDIKIDVDLDQKRRIVIHLVEN